MESAPFSQYKGYDFRCLVSFNQTRLLDSVRFNCILFGHVQKATKFNQTSKPKLFGTYSAVQRSERRPAACLIDLWLRIFPHVSTKAARYVPKASGSTAVPCSINKKDSSALFGKSRSAPAHPALSYPPAPSCSARSVGFSRRSEPSH